MEKLTINNFLLFKDSIEIDLKRINIFIGEQSAGKSVIVKLIYLFQTIPKLLLKSYFEAQHYEKSSFQEIFEKFFIESFLNIFPEKYWMEQEFIIEYSGFYKIKCSNIDGFLKLKYSENLELLFKEHKNLSKKLLEENFNMSYEELSAFMLKKDNKEFINLIEGLYDISALNSILFENKLDIQKIFSIYIPAGRIIYSLLQEKTNSAKFEYFIREFLENYNPKYIDNKLKQVEIDEESMKLFNDLLNGEYEIIDDEIIIKIKDEERELLHSSSGQQEVFPLILTLLNAFTNEKANWNFIIEEPESHLFPSFQNKMIKFIANNYNKIKNSTYTITTHSPYILTSLNTLLKASDVMQNLKKEFKKEDLYKIIPKNQIINFDDVSAYVVTNGKVKSIKDEEYKILDADFIDVISDINSQIYDELTDLKDYHNA